jgi:hypothetical protein
MKKTTESYWVLNVDLGCEIRFTLDGTKPTKKNGQRLIGWSEMFFQGPPLEKLRIYKIKCEKWSKGVSAFRETTEKITL